MVGALERPLFHPRSNTRCRRGLHEVLACRGCQCPCRAARDGLNCFTEQTVWKESLEKNGESFSLFL